jgi:hypothetical protein
MEKPLTKSITITGIESKFYDDNQSFTLLTDNGKYRFNSKKKDTDEETKAYQQFQKFKFKSGDTVEIGYYTSKKTFKNKEGKNITYDNNIIAYFSTEDDDTPQAPRREENTENTSLPTPTPNYSPDAISSLTQQIKQLNYNQEKLVNKILELEKKFRGLYGACVAGKKEVETAYEFHCEMDLKQADEEKPNLDVPF